MNSKWYYTLISCERVLLNVQKILLLMTITRSSFKKLFVGQLYFN
jgi:hypothetical protein